MSVLMENRTRTAVPMGKARRFWIEGTGGISMATGLRDHYEIRTDDDDGCLVRVARVLPPGREMAELLVKQANFLLQPEPEIDTLDNRDCLHRHGNIEHEHMWPHLPHAHMLRSICMKCPGFPTHDVHPMGPPTDTPDNERSQEHD